MLSKQLRSVLVASPALTGLTLFPSLPLVSARYLTYSGEEHDVDLAGSEKQCSELTITEPMGAMARG